MNTPSILVFAAVTLTAAGIISGSSCRSTLPPEPDVVVVPPDDDAGGDLDAARGSCFSAAENLHAISCAEAADAGAFAVVCAHAQAGKLTTLDVRCMTRAKTKTAARLCAGIGAGGCQ